MIMYVAAGELRGPTGLCKPVTTFILDVRLLPHRHDVDGRLRRRVLQHSPRQDFSRLLPPRGLGKFPSIFMPFLTPPTFLCRNFRIPETMHNQGCVPLLRHPHCLSGRVSGLLRVTVRLFLPRFFDISWFRLSSY